MVQIFGSANFLHPIFLRSSRYLSSIGLRCLLIVLSLEHATTLLMNLIIRGSFLALNLVERLPLAEVFEYYPSISILFDRPSGMFVEFSHSFLPEVVWNCLGSHRQSYFQLNIQRNQFPVDLQIHLYRLWPRKYLGEPIQIARDFQTPDNTIDELLVSVKEF